VLAKKRLRLRRKIWLVCESAKGRNGEVSTLTVIGELQNLTKSTRIREYGCQLVVLCG
jgi:hypothetical protein